MSKRERHKTDPLGGYQHKLDENGNVDHCHLCAAQLQWCIGELEGTAETEDTVEVLKTKRAASEIRDEAAEKRAKRLRWLFATLATGGFAPWVYKFAMWALQQAGG